MRNIQAGILPYEVHVDNWPEYSTVLAKPCDNDIQVTHNVHKSCKHKNLITMVKL